MSHFRGGKTLVAQGPEQALPQRRKQVQADSRTRRQLRRRGIAIHH